MKHTNSVCAVFVALLFFCRIPSAAEPEPPRVLATIKPIQSIAAAVTEGISDPLLLLDGNISPHLFQVKPSHVRLVSEAQVVVWAGEGVERFLPSMVENLNNDALMVSMAEHSTVQHLVRDKHSNHDHDAEDTRGSGEVDYHFWLDPENAMSFANALAEELSAIDPRNAALYKSNAVALVERLKTTSKDIKTLLKAGEGQQYFIYHDSLQYLEQAFALGEAIIVAPKPQVQAGGKRLRELREVLAEQQVGCLIAEPQFRSPVVQSIADDLGVETFQIDPLGAEFEAGVDFYSVWMLDLAAKLADCLATSGDVESTSIK